MTVGLRTSWLQYPVETITSPRFTKYDISIPYSIVYGIYRVSVKGEFTMGEIAYEYILL